MKPLWEHQKRGLTRYLEDPNIFNMSDCGVGKTRTLIEYIRRTNIPVLIFGPKSILDVAWAADLREFAPEVKHVVATAKNRRAAFENAARVKITNIDAAVWLTRPENKDLLTQFKGGLLVVDESTGVKNPASKRTKAIIKLRGIFASCTCLTGTPIPNSPLDIWSQVYIIDGGKHLGNSFYRFRANVCTPINKGAFTEWKPKEGITDAIADIIADMTIRDTRETCLDLPENQIIWRRFDLPPDQLKLYNDLKRKAIVETNTGIITAVNAAVLLNKLLQFCSGACYDENGNIHVIDTGRYELVGDLIEEQPHSVVFYNWGHQLKELVKVLDKRKITYGVIDGSVDSWERKAVIDALQAGKIQTLIGQIASVSHGITLTKATASIYMGATYNMEHFIQSKHRIHRGGQSMRTSTILVCANNTADEQAYKALFEKKSTMDILLDSLS